jgi:ribosomal protein S27E
MFLQIECPGCHAVLQVEESLAGKQGKCIHCGHKIVVPNKSGLAVSAQGAVAQGPPSQVAGSASIAPAAAPPPVLFLTEATPEAMIRELHERKKSALLLVFEPAADGSYDLANVPDAKIKCIATEDINQPRFMQLVNSFGKRFTMRKPAPPAAAPAAPSGMSPESSMVGRLSGTDQGPDQPYEIKGDPLGMTLSEFKQKYARFTHDGRQDLPVCSDMPGYIGKAELHCEGWHRKANIVHGRVDNPAEENSPTIAGIKTDLFLYQFVDGKLFRISAWFATDLFHMVNDAVKLKYGKPTRETKQPVELIWENNISEIVLTRGTVHPRTYSTLHMVHRELMEVVKSRAPKATDDI